MDPDRVICVAARQVQGIPKLRVEPDEAVIAAFISAVLLLSYAAYKLVEMPGIRVGKFLSAGIAGDRG